MNLKYLEDELPDFSPESHCDCAWKNQGEKLDHGSLTMTSSSWWRHNPVTQSSLAS